MRSVSNGSSEEDPLLPRPDAEAQAPKQQVTPLPKLQLAVLLSLQLAEPISSQVIYPFINQLVGELDITGGDRTKVGYYAGLIESLFFATQALFVFYWSRTSDRVGRRPVLLIGLGGLCLSMISFGLSRTFTSLVISRCLAGMLNGNTGVMKSMIGDITDSTNIAQAFAYLPVVWSVGMTIGPFAGGTLAHPYERFPNVFGQQLWKDYPYLLPCLFSALASVIGFVIGLVFLKETVTESNGSASTASVDTLAESSSHAVADGDGPLPVRRLMTRPVLWSIASYCTLAFSDICYFAIQPLFYSTAIEHGGLGLDPPMIGICLGIFGLINCVLQAWFSAKLTARFGIKRMLVLSMLSFVPIFAMFPVINHFARVLGMSWEIWVLVILQLFLAVVMDVGFCCVFIYLTSSAPNKRSLGSINGMAQTTASIARTIGPATATSLYAFSMQNQLLGGNAVYLILIASSFVGLSFALQLPRQPWIHATA